MVGLIGAFALGAVARQALFVLDVMPEPVSSAESVKVRVQSGAQARSIRADLVQYLFGSDELPANEPIDQGDGTYSVPLEHGMVSLVHELTPAEPNGRLVLYHAGHTPYGDVDRPVVEALLAGGFTVVVFDMPLVGVNAGEVRVEGPNGPLVLSRHDHLAYLDPLMEGSPISLFIEPVIVMLNELDARFEDISMVGLSGGGWTTTIAAALDQRIDRSFPAAGTLPLSARLVRPDSWGDWEQHEHTFYELAGYEDLYVLGALERRQLQILNENDPCCYGGDYRAAYLSQVQAALAASGGGDFDVYLDRTNRDHSIGPAAMDVVLSALGQP
jgi:hypothetical protein